MSGEHEHWMKVSSPTPHLQENHKPNGHAILTMPANAAILIKFQKN